MNPTPGAMTRSVPDATDAEAAGAVSRIAAAKPAAAVNTESVVSAQSLLAGRPWVGIEHNGQYYRLQTTRAGKLILTK